MVKMSAIWDRTAEFLSDNIAQIVPIALLAFFVPASIEGNFEAAITEASAGTILILRLMQLAFALLSVWGSLVITAIAIDPLSDRTAARVALSRLVPSVVVWLALLIVIGVLALPIPLTLAASGHDLDAIAAGQAFSLSGQAAGFAALYAIALMVLVIWIFTRLAIVTPVILHERRMFGAIPQSWRLTRGLTLRLLGTFILYLLVSWVSQLAARTVFGSIFALVAGGGGEGVTLAGVLTSIVVGAVETAFLVIASAFIAKLYLALISKAGFLQGAASAA